MPVQVTIEDPYAERCDTLNKFTQDECEAICKAVNLEVKNIFKLQNRYWPRHIDYWAIRENSPWFLLDTPFGLIMLGYRKRVMHIDWTNTPLRKIITEDDTTKDATCVHAWDRAKVLEYLLTLVKALKEHEAQAQRENNDE